MQKSEHIINAHEAVVYVIRVPSSSSGIRAKDGAGVGQLCHIYAQIHEETTHSNIVVCSGQQQQQQQQHRDQVVYTSESNVVKVELIYVKAAINTAYFLIKFEGMMLSTCSIFVLLALTYKTI